MDNETFRTRLVKLIQKSRKALRLYSSVGRAANSRSNEFSDVQVQEWREVNADLVKQLSGIVDSPNTRKLVSSVFSVRDRFYTEWRMAETELHNGHKDLIFASENGDFARAAQLSKDLVMLKARVQALHAAHHELQELIDISRVSQKTIELSRTDIVTDEVVETAERTIKPEPTFKIVPAKVIPLRRRTMP